MIFFFPIEIKIREFFNKTFLAYHIVKNGGEAIIGGQRDIPINISKMENCYWLDKNIFLKKVNKKIDMRYINKNFLGMLDEEGPVSFFEEWASEMRYPKELTHYYDSFFFWGKKDLDAINKKFSFYEDKLVIGHPKYDLLKKPFVKVWNNEVEKIKKRYGNFFLFNSSFKLRPSKIDNRKSIINARDNLKNKKKLKEALARKESLYQTEGKNYSLTIELIKELALDNPKKNFIYRPHPSENIYNARVKFGIKPKNVHIVFKGVVSPWIIACDTFVHSGCTTVLEAAILKKKIICFLPTGKSRRYKMYSEIGHFFSNKESCKNFLNKFLNEKKPNLNLDYVSSIIDNFKKKSFFYKNFINHLKNKSFFKKKSKISMGKILYSKRAIFFYKFKQNIFKILSVIKDHIVLKTPLIYLLNQKYMNSKLNRDRKLTAITKMEINNIFNKIKKAENSKMDFKISKISKNVFRIKRNLND